MTAPPENPWENPEPDYVPVYGSRITPASFEWDGKRWRVSAHDAEGRETEFAFEFSDSGAPIATANGEPAQFRDIHSGAARRATAADWFDAISYWDTQARTPLQDPRWSGDTLEAAGVRMKDEVVAYETPMCNLANYATPEALEAELKRLLAPLAVTVRTIEAWPEGPTSFGRRIVDGEDDMACKAWFDDTVDPVPWLHSLDRKNLRPYAWARFEGTQFTAFESEMAFRPSDLPEGVLLSDDPSHPWWLLIIENQDAALPVHRMSFCLDAHIDQDGQSVAFAVRPTADVARERKLSDAYERRWGHLMDDRNPPADAEVERAILLAHSRIED